MRYNINDNLIYDAADGSLTPCGRDAPETQLSITASALFLFFITHKEIISRNEVLSRVWDDNGLTSSNSNLNQYLSILLKTFRQYDIENIIVTVSRGHLQLNPVVTVLPLAAESHEAEHTAQRQVSSQQTARNSSPKSPTRTLHTQGMCWYMASITLLVIAGLLVAFTLSGSVASRVITLNPIQHSLCELLASEEMLNSVSATSYVRNFEAVRQRLNLTCQPSERFVFFYGDRLQTNGLGRVYLAHCAMHENNPFSYCVNYFYYSWSAK